MKVKISKMSIVTLILVGSVCALFPLVFIENKIFMLCVYILFGLLFLKCWFVLGRTLEFSENGCTVAFLFIKKNYTWEELKTGYILNESHKLLGRYNTYDKSVIFSKKKMPRALKTVSIQSYAMLCLNPARFFYVNIAPCEHRRAESSASSGFYEVDGQEFFEKLREWNVELIEQK